MNSRERIDRLLHLEEADHVGFNDGPWGTTIEKWERQGLPKGIFVQEHFGMDFYGIGVDTSPKYDEMTFERGDDYVISRDRYGVKQKRWVGASEGIPLHLDPPFTNLEEFEERIEPMLDPDYPMRISSPKYPFRHEIEGMYRKFQEKFFVYASFYGTFEYTRHICGGTKKALRHMMIDPKLTKRMYKVLARFMGAISSAMCDAGADCAWVFDDLGFADGPFFSPENYRKYVKASHEAITKPFRKQGRPAILHTDGNVNLLIPDFLDAGFTALHPLEVNAGMDIFEVKEKYGDKLAFFGNIDKRTLATNDLGRIEGEVESKVKVAMQGGGYVLGSDHSISPEVDLDTFKAFSKMGIKYGSYS